MDSVAQALFGALLLSAVTAAMVILGRARRSNTRPGPGSEVELSDMFGLAALWIILAAASWARSRGLGEQATELAMGVPSVLVYAWYVYRAAQAHLASRGAKSVRSPGGAPPVPDRSRAGAARPSPAAFD